MRQILATLVLLLSGCADSQEKYLGKFSYKNPFIGKEEILEIKKDGDAYLFNEDITSINKITPMKKIPEGFEINSKTISLSADNNTLYFSNQSAQRVDSSYAEKYLLKIKENKKNCDELQIEVNTKHKEISDSKKWNEYVKTLKAREPEDCNLENSGMRW
jgi:hypothetical protein